jgi:hypothetical protein
MRVFHEPVLSQQMRMGIHFYFSFLLASTMNSEQLIAAGLALVALVPIVLYQLGLGNSVSLGLSIVSIIVIAVSFYTMFSAAEDGHAT